MSWRVRAGLSCTSPRSVNRSCSRPAQCTSVPTTGSWWRNTLAVELTVVIMCRDDADADNIMDVLQDGFDVIEFTTEEV